MRRRNFDLVFAFLFVFLCLFSYRTVEAKSVAMGISGDKNTVEPGDTIKIDLIVSCVAKGTNVSKMDTGFEYDSNIFTLVSTDDVKYYTGWKSIRDELNDKTGSYSISLKADSSKNYISIEDASDKCSDDKYITLVSGYELKVKDVANQKTKIWSLQDGSRSTSMEINVFKANDNTDLKELNVEGVEIAPSFSSSVTSYEAEVGYDKDKIVINATCVGEGCNVSNTGEKELQVGENRFEIIVTAENGSKKKYNLFVNRKEASSDTTLSSLKIKDSNGSDVNFGFKSDKRNYTVNVGYDVLFVTFDTKCSGDNCKVDDVSTEKLDVGDNDIVIKVTAEDGSTSEYKINIIREKKKSIVPYIVGGVMVIIIIVIGVLFFIKRGKDRKLKRTNVEPIIDNDDSFDIDNLQ